MKLRKFGLGMMVCVAGVLVCKAQTATMDWKFSSAGNPSAPTSVANVTNTATASFLSGNNTYYFGAGPEGVFGPPTGLWSMERLNSVNSLLEFKLDATPVTTVNLSLVVYQFIDENQSFYPGTLSFNLPNAQYDGRTVYVQQTGIMTGFWVTDTYHWNAVSFPGQPITLDISPGGGSGAVFLDEAFFTVSGQLTAVPEPMALQLGIAGLLVFGCGYGFHRKYRV